MKKYSVVFAFMTSLILALPIQAAEEADANPTINRQLQEKYDLSAEDAKLLEDSKLSEPGKIKAVHLSSQSDKPLADVLKMRNDDKMGWGQIAKQLGVHPGELGKSVAGMRHDRNNLKKAEKRADQQERKTARAERKLERKASMAERRQKNRELRSEHPRGRKK